MHEIQSKDDPRMNQGRMIKRRENEAELRRQREMKDA